MKNPRHILITGASSGIGEALALHYAAPGVSLRLSGRNADRLADVAKRCEAAGAAVHTATLDVTDKATMEGWIAAADAERPLDLVIANAGVGLGPKEGQGLADITERTFAVNVDGVFHTVHPAISRMKKRGQGQIAIISSIAGLIGMPNSPGYSASKNAVRAYGEALRGVYAKRGIEVNVVCPGFVVSRITDKNKFPMPFLMPAPRAARIIARGLARNKGRIAFPAPTYLVVRLLTLLPTALAGRIMSAGPSK